MDRPQRGLINPLKLCANFCICENVYFFGGVTLLISLSPYQLSKDTYLNDLGNKVE